MVTNYPNDQPARFTTFALLYYNTDWAKLEVKANSRVWIRRDDSYVDDVYTNVKFTDTSVMFGEKQSYKFASGVVPYVMFLRTI